MDMMMTTTPLYKTKSDEEFKEKFDRSVEAVEMTYWYLLQLGLTVFMPEPVFRDAYEERKNYIDNGDLFIQHNPPYGPLQTIEVKRRKQVFSGEHDYPWDGVMVNQIFKVDKDYENPLYAYLIISNDLKYCCWIFNHTRDHWYKATIRDPTERNPVTNKKGNKSLFYFCPKELCQFSVFIPPPSLDMCPPINYYPSSSPSIP